MSEGTVKRAKLKYPFEMALNERDFFTEKTETRATPLTCPRCHRKNDYQMKLGAADQEEQAFRREPTNATARSTRSCAIT